MAPIAVKPRRSQAPAHPEANERVVCGLVCDRRTRSPTSTTSPVIPPAARRDGRPNPVFPHLPSSNWHIISCEYPPQVGGVADFTRVIARGLAARGESVDVWAP